jgi:hypothetical protein
MLTSSNPFDCKTILEGIRPWVEIETPTQMHTPYEQMYISSIEPRARLLYRLYQTLR